MNIRIVLCLYHRIENWFLEAKWYTSILFSGPHVYIMQFSILYLSPDIFSNALYTIVINNIFCGVMKMKK